MTMPCDIRERESDKFVECKGKSAVRTKICQEDGESIKVDIVEDGANGEVFNEYDTALSVAKDSPTIITTYIVPAGKATHLKLVEVSGSNRSTFTIKKNGQAMAVKRTRTNELNEEFEFHNLKIDAGDRIDVEVVHSRGSLGDYEARILGNEI